MNRILIACYSHLYMPTTLTIILSKPCFEYYIFTDNNSIKELFTKSQLNVHVIFQPFTSNRLSDFYRIYSYKKKILRYVISLNINEIYFFHDGECMPFNWLIAKLHNRLKITYVPLYKDNLPIVRYPSARQLFRAMKTYLYWGIMVKYLKDRSNNQYFTKSFIRHNDINLGSISVNKILIHDNVMRICPGIENFYNKILIVQSEHVGTIIDKEEYVSIINKIILSLGINRFVFKAKPNWEKSYGLETECMQIPSYLSANLIINHFVGCIGTTSALLGEACNESVPTFCLLDLFSTLNVDETNRFKRYLMSLNSNIMYPQTIDQIIKQLRAL